MLNPKWLCLYKTFGRECRSETNWDEIDINLLLNVFMDDDDFGCIIDNQRRTLKDYLSMKHMISD